MLAQTKLPTTNLKRITLYKNQLAVTATEAQDGPVASQPFKLGVPNSSRTTRPARRRPYGRRHAPPRRLLGRRVSTWQLPRLADRRANEDPSMMVAR